jgi:indolepyruvate ferredoxin oxidoreductase alpha subunit
VKVRVRGKLDGTVPNAGENSPAGVRRAIGKFLGIKTSDGESGGGGEQAPPMPVRPPILCAGCPHRGSFYAVKEAARGRKAVFSGDIGCYTLGNAMPLDMVDTCLCMGAGITMAQGINRVEPDTANFAFIGDSTFFHGGVTGIINAVYNKSDIIVAVLDNSTTAMTGGQPHPGTGKTIAGADTRKADIYSILSAIGLDDIQRVSAFDFKSSKSAVKHALGVKGVRAVIFEGECVSMSKSANKRSPLSIEKDSCVGCKICARKLGCPAISMRGGKSAIDASSCTGCGLCADVCPKSAIKGGGA